MKKNQKGFSVVELLLVLVVVGLIGAAGWYVWSKNNSDKTPTASNTPTTSNADKEEEPAPQEYERTATIPGDWKTFTSDKYKLTLEHPSGWTISTNLMTKKAGSSTQNIYSDDATEIFVICYKETAQSQMCADQININNQPLEQSLTALRKYYEGGGDYGEPSKETEMTIDGHKLVEFHTKASQTHPGKKSYFLGANGYTYGLTTVYEGKSTESSLSAAESLALFESIKVQ